MCAGFEGHFHDVGDGLGELGAGDLAVFGNAEFLSKAAIDFGDGFAAAGWVDVVCFVLHQLLDCALF